MNDHSALGGQSLEQTDAAAASAVHQPAAVNGEAAGHVNGEAGEHLNGGTNGQLNGHSFGMHELLHALQAMRIGDFSVRLPSDQTGIEGKIADTFNEIAAANERM